MSHPYQNLGLQLLTYIRRSANAFWLLIAVAYLSISAGRAVYANYAEQQQLSVLKHQLVDAQQERERLQALLVYYASDDYKELAIRRSLLLKMPGEQVFALPESSGPSSLDDEEQVAAAVTPQIKLSHTSIPSEWLDYFLHGKKEV